MADTTLDVTYYATMFGSGTIYCFVPDFSVMATGSTKEEAISNVQLLVQADVDNSKLTGKRVPASTPRSVLEQKWSPSDYEYSTVVVRV